MTARKSFAGVLALTALCYGCGSHVIPGTVVEGTTATIAIPYDFDVGYGRAWAGNSSENEPVFIPSSWNPLEDLQRGELIFRLYNAPTGGTSQAKLAVRYITRVARDPSSSYSYGTADFTQPIAFLDIPYGLVADGATQDFYIEVHRYRRDPNNINAYVAIPQSYWSEGTPVDDWWGWGQPNSTSRHQRIPITVMDSPDDTNGLPDPPGRYTPIEAWGPYPTRGGTGGQVRTGIVTQTTLDNSIPLPEFRVLIPGSGAPPYAWEMQLTYPAARMQVFDVRLLRENPSAAIAIWKVSHTTPPECSSPTSGTLELRVADPMSTHVYRVRGVAVTFRLVNQDTPACNQRIALGEVDFVPNSYRGYDVNGNLLTGPSPFQIVNYDLY